MSDTQKFLLPEKVHYVSKGYKHYKMLRKATSEKLVTDGVTGTQTKFTDPAEYVQFEGFDFYTNDPEIVAFLDAHPDLTGITKNGKVAKICIERALPRDAVQDEFIELCKEFGRDNVVAMMRNKRTELQAPGASASLDNIQVLVDTATKKLEIAEKHLKKAQQSGNKTLENQAIKMIKKWSAKIAEVQSQLHSTKTVGG